MNAYMEAPRATCVGCGDRFVLDRSTARYCVACREDGLPQRDASRRYNAKRSTIKTRNKGVRTLSPWGSYNAVPPDALVPYPVACSLGDRTQYLYLRTCAVCRQPRPMLSYRRACSNNCKGVLISMQRSGQMSVARAAEAHERTVQMTEARDVTRILRDKLDPIAAYRLGKRSGYRLGETKGIVRERRAWENGRR